MQKKKNIYRMWYGSSVVAQWEGGLWEAEILLSKGAEEGKYPAFSEYRCTAEFDPKMPEKGGGGGAVTEYEGSSLSGREF